MPKTPRTKRRAKRSRRKITRYRRGITIFNLIRSILLKKGKAGVGEVEVELKRLVSPEFWMQEWRDINAGSVRRKHAATWIDPLNIEICVRQVIHHHLMQFLRNDKCRDDPIVARKGKVIWIKHRYVKDLKQDYGHKLCLRFINKIKNERFRTDVLAYTGAKTPKE